MANGALPKPDLTEEEKLERQVRAAIYNLNRSNNYRIIDWGGYYLFRHCYKGGGGGGGVAPGIGWFLHS